MLQHTYFFNPDEYEREGQRVDDPDVLFHHFIEECEKDFYARSSPLAANQFKANARTMLLLQACFEVEEESFGMDGDQDLDTNMRIDAHSEKVTIFAIGSSIPEKEDEPLFLVIDDGVPDGQFELSYVSDDGDDEEGDCGIPHSHSDTHSRLNAPPSSFLPLKGEKAFWRVVPVPTDLSIRGYRRVTPTASCWYCPFSSRHGEAERRDPPLHVEMG